MTACIALVAAAFAAGSPAADLPAAPAVPATGSLDLTGGWRVRADPGGSGAAKRWDAAAFDDSGWEVQALPRSGVAEPVWCRRWVDIPEGWPRMSLVLEGIRGQADLWMNGLPVRRDLSRLRGENGAVILDMARLTEGKRRCMFALRLAGDAGGPAAAGGASLVSYPRPWFPSLPDWLGYLASESPGLPWPSWLRGDGTAWMSFAEPGGGPGGILGWNGGIGGGECPAAVSCWLWDRGSRRLYSSPSVPARLRLEGRYLPLPSVSMQAGRVFALTVAAWPLTVSLPGRPPLTVAVGEAVVENVSDRPREVDLVIAVHPFGARGSLLPVREVGYDRATQVFSVNGAPALMLAGAPDAVGAAPFGDDSVPGGAWALVQSVMRGEAPGAVAAADPAGLASGAAVYRLRLQPFGKRMQSFRVFLAGAAGIMGAGGAPDQEAARAVRELDRAGGWRDAAASWQKLVAGKEGIFVRVPDKAVQDAFSASLGHLLVALASGRIAGDTGELAAAALLRTGHPAAAATLAGPGAWALAPAPGGTSATPVVEGTLRPSLAFEGAWGAARSGDGEAAAGIMRWWILHPTTPGACAWSGSVDPATFRHAGGELPDPRAAALFICALRDMLVREDGDSLALAPALPESWCQPGRIVDVRNIPTAFGVLPGYVITGYQTGLTLRAMTPERLAAHGRWRLLEPGEIARPPGGLRWRIPGSRRVAEVRVNGASLGSVPADRTVVLPPGFRDVRVNWKAAGR